MDSFRFKNLNDIIEGISFRAEHHHITITSLDVTETHVNIQGRWFWKQSDAIEFFRHVVGTVECAQDICGPMFITNHICEEYYLDMEDKNIEINIICNRRFNKDDYYK